jgi:molybdate transport system substrate-binding protein
VKRNAAVIVALCLVTAACDQASETSSSSQTELTVFAAASLTDAFEEIGMAYERDNPGISIRFNFLASSDLATQIVEGAPADVFASADEVNMRRLEDEDLVESGPEVFAHNKLAIIVPADNPGHVQSFRDLENDNLVVALCVEECPAGKYALEIFGRTGLDVEPDSLEGDVKAVVTRVELGEADAGIVYVTDILAAGNDVAGIDIADDDNVIATYPIATLAGSDEASGDFVDFVESEGAQQILSNHGFLPK